MKSEHLENVLVVRKIGIREVVFALALHLQKGIVEVVVVAAIFVSHVVLVGAMRTSASIIMMIHGWKLQKILW